MNKIFAIFLGSLLMSSIANSASFLSNTLDAYTCTSEESARSCTKCKLDKNVALQFNVNTDKSVVILTFFEDRKNVNGGALENCKVVDKKNWQCGNDGSYNEYNTFTQNTHAMVNGIYFSINKFHSRGIAKTNIGPMNSESFNCAK